MPLPAAPAVFRGVSCCRLPLGGSATFLAPVACPAPAVELCCWVCGVLVASLGFLLGCRALPPGTVVGAAYPAAGYPWGLLPFLTPSA